MKLRRLRTKLRKLKAEYQYSEDEEQSEKSEMDTLQDLKRATEQAIRELQVEAAKANKRKGENEMKRYLNLVSRVLSFLLSSSFLMKEEIGP